jgi:uncharacterized membrane protein
MQFARWLHVMGVVVWVGGMFFAHMALRPAVQSLAPPERLPLLAAALSRFIAWVAVAIVAIVATGFAMVAMMGAVGYHVHAMIAVGLAMVAIYLYIVAVPLRGLRGGVAARDWPRAGAAMPRIRQLVAVNLVLGIAVIAVAYLGRS